MSEAVKPRGSEQEEGVQLYLHGKAYEALKEIADERGIDIMDVLRDAIGLQVYYEEVRKEGGQIVAQRKGQPDTHVIVD